VTVDRLPSAAADTKATTEGAVATTGNLITNDDEGNTNATVTAATQGANNLVIGTAFNTAAGGSITINADGSYSYTAPAALGEGSVLTETFNYTITDNDGDTSGSTLTVTIDRLPAAAADDAAAKEGGSVVAGNVITNDDEGITNAAVTAANQGGAAITIGSAFVTREGGKLTINADGSYTYLPPEVLLGTGAVTETFNYTITDADGDVSSSTLTISVERGLWHWVGEAGPNAKAGSASSSEASSSSDSATRADASEELLIYRTDPVQFYRAPILPLAPVFSGEASPGTVLMLTLYNERGAQIGFQCVVADTGGNWMASFPSAVVTDFPETIRIVQTSGGTDMADGSFNFRPYFVPALQSGHFFTENLSPNAVFASRAEQVMNSLEGAMRHPISFGLEKYTYEFLCSEGSVGKT
ncbi:MAG TPA: hypothetical protein DCM05_12330, partial [Elusimicrobia bacterium]|nr:hypothetical protein [Elusimicrobiota bacterium]